MIKKLREERGMSQNELARRSGVRQSSLSAIESGKTTHPRIDTIIKIARALNIPVERLLEG